MFESVAFPAVVMTPLVLVTRFSVFIIHSPPAVMQQLTGHSVKPLCLLGSLRGGVGEAAPLLLMLVKQTQPNVFAMLN